MAAPITDLFEAILAALGGIRREAGYDTDVRRIVAGPARAGSPGPTPLVAVQLVRESVTPLPARRTRRVLRVQVTVLTTGAAAEARRKLEAALADVERALMTDPTQNGRAVSTVPVEQRVEQTLAESGARGWCVYEFVRHEDAP